ncbi:hypothetical protein D9M72_618990 [compost metagenome]
MFWTASTVNVSAAIRLCWLVSGPLGERLIATPAREFASVLASLTLRPSEEAMT